MPAPKLILASGSPRRKELLARLGFMEGEDFIIRSADIDETEKKGEKPYAYCKRMAREKAQKVWEETREDFPNTCVLGADTPVFAGRKILQNPVDVEDAREMLRTQSGRRVYIATAVCLITPEGKAVEELSKSWVKFKPFTPAEIENHLKNEENWRGASGAFKIQTSAIEQYITCTHGSMTGIIGLPLYETRKILSRANL